MTWLLKSKNGHKGSLRPTTRVFFHAFPMCFFGFLHVFLHCVHFSHPRALQPRVFFFHRIFFSPSCCNPFLIFHISITSSVSSYLSSFIFKNLAHLFNFQAFNVFTTIRVPTHCQHFAFPDVQLWCVDACASYLSASRQSFVTGIMTTQQQATQRHIHCQQRAKFLVATGSRLEWSA